MRRRLADLLWNIRFRLAVILVPGRHILIAERTSDAAIAALYDLAESFALADLVEAGLIGKEEPPCAPDCLCSVELPQTEVTNG